MPADGDRFPGERVVVTAFVIEHPKGVFLFDTGFSPEPRKMVDLYQPVYMRPIDEALRAAGHGITDVKLIANCHFHADHAGGNRHFARTPIFVQKRELAHARKENDYTHMPHVAAFPGAVLAGQALNFSSDYARHQYSHELALAGESHASYPDWISRFHELDPVRVHFAHDRAIWERDVAESIR